MGPEGTPLDLAKLDQVLLVGEASSPSFEIALLSGNHPKTKTKKLVLNRAMFEQNGESTFRVLSHEADL